MTHRNLETVFGRRTPRNRQPAKTPNYTRNSRRSTRPGSSGVLKALLVITLPTREADGGEPVLLGFIPFQSGGQMGVEVVPHHDDWAAELVVRAGQQVTTVLPRETLPGALEQEVAAGPVNEAARLARPVSAQGGHRCPTVELATNTDDGRASAPAPGASDRWRHREPGLVVEDDPRAGRRHEAFTRGHTSFFHSSTVCLSRSRARRTGVCQEDQQRQVENLSNWPAPISEHNRE